MTPSMKLVEPFVGSEILAASTGTQDPLATTDAERFAATGTEGRASDPSVQASPGPTDDLKGTSENDSSKLTEATPALKDTLLTNEAETWSFVHGQLARQLEYYFSEKNLSKDTYVQTLRELNDCCVPVSILANFAMVKRLVSSLTFVIEEGRLAAVEEAARNHSDRLMACLIDTKTGLRVKDELGVVKDATHHILAVGTIDGKPLILENNVCLPSPGAKTIVLRDVAHGVTKEEIYEVFNQEEFPAVQDAHPDVASCWFVTLDTDDKSDLMQVMLSLRSMTLRDAPIHARIKSTADTTLVDTAPVLPLAPTKKKKRKVRGKKKRDGQNPFYQKRGQSGSQPVTTWALAPPPTLGEDNFPTLQDKKVEWETTPVLAETGHSRRGSSSSDDEEDEEYEDRNSKADDLEDEKGENELKSLKAMSDGTASTATTTSSSLESLPKKILPAGGYAAALMGASKIFPSLTTTGVVASSTSARPGTVSSGSKAVAEELNQPMATTLAPKSDVWGGRRSFADVVFIPQETRTTSS